MNIVAVIVCYLIGSINFAYLVAKYKKINIQEIGSGNPGSSNVLRALGRNDELAHSSIRFSIGRYTTEDHVKFTVGLLKDQVARLREMSPLWEMYKDGIDLDSIQWAAH